MIIKKRFKNLLRIEACDYIAYITKKFNSFSSRADIPYIYSKANNEWVLPPIGGDQFEKNIYSSFSNGIPLNRINRKLITLEFGSKFIHFYTFGLTIILFSSDNVKVFSFPKSNIYRFAKEKTNSVSVLGFYKMTKHFYAKF